MSLESNEKSERSVPLTASQQAAAKGASTTEKARLAGKAATAPKQPKADAKGDSQAKSSEAKPTRPGGAPALTKEVSAKETSAKETKPTTSKAPASPEEKSPPPEDKAAAKARAKQEKADAKARAKQEKADAKERAKAEKEERKKSGKADQRKVAAGGIKELAILHAEKGVLALAAVAALALIYMSWGKFTLAQNQSPEQLSQNLHNLGERIKVKPFSDEMKKFTVPPFDATFERFRTPVRPNGMPGIVSWDPVIVEPHKRDKPEIYPPQQLIAIAGAGNFLQKDRLRPLPGPPAPEPGGAAGVRGAAGGPMGAAAPRRGAAPMGAGPRAQPRPAPGAAPGRNPPAPAPKDDSGELGGGAVFQAAVVPDNEPVDIPPEILEKLGGVRPPADTKIKVYPEARRWAVILALLPVSQQDNEYTQKFAYAIERTAHDEVAYGGVRMIRYLVTPGSAELKLDKEWTWQEQLDYDRKERNLWVMEAPEIVPDKFVRKDTARLFEEWQALGLGVMTKPLGPLLNQSWRKWAIHPGLYEATKAEAPSEPAPMEAEAEAKPEEEVKPSADKPAGNDLFPQAAPTPPPATKKKEPPKVAKKSPAPKPATRDGEQEFQLVRIFDFTVEPGKQYQYKLEIMVRNPNYEKNEDLAKKNLVDPKLALEKHLLSPLSEASNTVAIPDGQSVLADTVVRPEPPAPVDNNPRLAAPPAAPQEALARIVVKVLNFDASQETFASLDVRRGALVADTAEQIVLDPLKNTVASKKEATVRTDLVLADFHGGQRLEEGLDAPTEMLFIDAAGNLVVQNSAHDELTVSTFRELEALVKQQAAAAREAARAAQQQGGPMGGNPGQQPKGGAIPPKAPPRNPR